MSRTRRQCHWTRYLLLPSSPHHTPRPDDGKAKKNFFSLGYLCNSSIHLTHMRLETVDKLRTREGWMDRSCHLTYSIVVTISVIMLMYDVWNLLIFHPFVNLLLPSSLFAHSLSMALWLDVHTSWRASEEAFSWGYVNSLPSSSSHFSQYNVRCSQYEWNLPFLSRNI